MNMRAIAVMETGNQKAAGFSPGCRRAEGESPPFGEILTALQLADETGAGGNGARAFEAALNSVPTDPDGTGGDVLVLPVATLVGLNLVVPGRPAGGTPVPGKPSNATGNTAAGIPLPSVLPAALSSPDAPAATVELQSDFSLPAAPEAATDVGAAAANPAEGKSWVNGPLGAGFEVGVTAAGRAGGNGGVLAGETAGPALGGPNSGMRMMGPAVSVAGAAAGDAGARPEAIEVATGGPGLFTGQLVSSGPESSGVPANAATATSGSSGGQGLQSPYGIIPVREVAARTVGQNGQDCDGCGIEVGRAGAGGGSAGDQGPGFEVGVTAAGRAGGNGGVLAGETAGLALGGPNSGMRMMGPAVSVAGAAAGGARARPEAIEVATGGSGPPAGIQVSSGLESGGVVTNPAITAPNFSGGEGRQLPYAVMLAGEIVGQGLVVWQRGQGSVRMQLKPESLGQVEVRLTSRPGWVAAHLVVESDLARNLVQGCLPSLQQSLAQYGLSCDSIRVEVGCAGAGSDGAGDQGAAGERSGGFGRQSSGTGSGWWMPESGLYEGTFWLFDRLA